MKNAFLKYLNPLIEYIQFNFKVSTLIAVGILSALKHFVLQYVFDDFAYLISFSLLFAFYVISGSAKAILKGEFRLYLFFGKVILKVSSYVIFIGGVSIFVKMTVGGQKIEWVQSVDNYLLMVAAANVFFNTAKNVIIINPGLLPEKVEKWFREGAETGTLTKPI